MQNKKRDYKKVEESKREALIFLVFKQGLKKRRHLKIQIQNMQQPKQQQLHLEKNTFKSKEYFNKFE